MTKHPEAPLADLASELDADADATAYVKPRREMTRFSPAAENHSKARAWRLEHPRRRPDHAPEDGWLTAVTSWLRR